MAAIFLAGVALGPGMAAADPISDVGAAGYQALFDADVPVYEVVSVDWFTETQLRPGSNGEYLRLRRIPNPQAGAPETARYAIAGKALTNEFWLPADLSGGRVPSALINPRPSPYGYAITYWDPLGATVLQIGPVAIPGVPTPSISGAIAIG
ncbi:hypothetical protein [Rhodococcus marinonascens]|uniref:hypothetical protein n=1 Tax=Rhodococcus marinonascens TaxID=38311 RepID=UPI0009329265|nr:hypothetical protein [Rhodococcus marinonascens]